MSIFYRILWNGKEYIGELSEGTFNGDFMEYHFKQALPWNKNMSLLDKENQRWERYLNDMLKRRGFKATRDSFKISESADASAVITRISNSMDNFLAKEIRNAQAQGNLDKIPYAQVTPGKFYKDTVMMIGQTDERKDILVPEMLLILLRAKETALWNLHANYGSRGASLADHRSIITAKMLQQREYDASRWQPYIFYTFDLETLPDDLAAAIAAQCKITYNATTNHRQVAMDIRSSRGRKIVNSIKKIVKDSTLDSLVKQLLGYKEFLLQKGSVDAEQAANDIDEVIKTINNDFRGKRKQYKTLAAALDNLLIKKQNGYIQPTKINILENFADLLNKWLDQTAFSSIWGGASSYDMDEIDRWYKNNFINHIQKLCFNDGYNDEYQDWKKDQFDDWQASWDFYSPGSFYPEWLKIKNNLTSDSDEIYTRENVNNNRIEIASLCDKTETKIQGEGDFIRENWRSLIYPEQVALYLTQNSINFPYDSRLLKGSLSKGFIFEIREDDIKWY